MQRVHAGPRHLLHVGEEALLALPGQAVDEVGVGDRARRRPSTLAGREGFVRRVAAVDRAEDAGVEALDPHADAADPVPAQHLDVARPSSVSGDASTVCTPSPNRVVRRKIVSSSSSSSSGRSAVGVPPPTNSCASGVPGVHPLQLALQGADVARHGVVGRRRCAPRSSRTCSDSGRTGCGRTGAAGRASSGGRSAIGSGPNAGAAPGYSCGTQ